METNEIILVGTQMKKLIEKKSAPIIRRYGLRPVELDILVFLYQSPRDTAKDIMSSRHFSKAHISKSIENLRSRGFVRLSEDSEDHRVVHICLTGQTEEVVKEMIEVYQTCVQAVMKNITEEERMMMSRVWHKMLTGIDEEMKKFM
ncbi:MAG: MarR family transcriptional regulator [Lachnospiraceae bacterium]|nr:MarR family transcriptional regulator [Lachnospiraceae bacterium]